MALSPLFRPVSFDELPGWRRGRQVAGLRGIPALGLHVLTKPYRSGALGVDFAAFAEAYEAARRTSQPAIRPRRSAFFETHFRPDAPGSLRTAGRASSPASTSRRPRPRRSAPSGSRCRCCRGRPTSSMSTTPTARRAWTPISPSAARRQAGIVEYFDRAGDRAGRAGRARAGDRLARATRSTPSSSMCRARRGCR